MKVNECKFCLESKELIEAHIIPNAFFKSLRSASDSPARKYDSSPYTKNAPKGEYDPNLLCRECEDVFQKWDDYAINVLIPAVKNKKEMSNGGDLHLGSYDLNKLTLFFLSLLWRGHHSKRDFYKKISLGPYENRIKKSLVESNNSIFSEYPIALSKYTDTAGQGSIPSPEPVKYENLNFYMIELGYGYSCLIKVDKRPLTSGINKNFLKPGELIVVQFSSWGTFRDNRLRKFIRDRR
jgi:hypothetical protein